MLQIFFGKDLDPVVFPAAPAVARTPKEIGEQKPDVFPC
jgi:hypothetical protein